MSPQPKIRRADPPKNIVSPEKGIQIIRDFLGTAQKPLIALVGPTASGKTDFSIRAAKAVDAEIINADSRQFYKGMDIGTAKITPKEMDGIPHHLMSFLSPEEECPAGVFKNFAEEKAEEILSRKKIPFLVGGSGLFVDVIRKNFSVPRVPPQKSWRASLESLSAEALYERLQKLDPEAAKKMSPQNKNRIIRALEVIEFTGEKMSEQQKRSSPKFDFLLLGVWVEPEILEQRIKERTEKLWKWGFLDEVRNLMDQGCAEETPSMIAHGYREAMGFLKGEISAEKAKYLMERNTRRYAKRQRTWWRREKEMLWIGTMSS